MTSMITTPFGPQFEPMPVPDRLEFRLPDGTQAISELLPTTKLQNGYVHVNGSSNGSTETHANGEAVKDPQDASRILLIYHGENKVFQFVPQDRKLRISPYGIVNDDRAESANVLRLESILPKSSEVEDTIANIWVALYGLWLRHVEEDYLPVELPTEESCPGVLDYLIHSGLAISAIDSPESSPSSVLAIRASFWQSAGAPPRFSWLRSPFPAHLRSPLSTSVFPFTPSFTRGPHVLTTHPLRPPKPAPGSVLYSRFICAVGQTLTFTHINANDERHFEAYCRWQNDERVNVGWREKGPQEKHRKYLEDRLADKHIMGFVVEWDGELAGYGEMSWVKEDPMSTYVGGLGDYDQGTHLLVGEEKFRGRHRFTAIMVSMKHACFLRDSRTEIVVGEPRADLPIVPRLKTFLPQEFNREFDLPHKRAVYFVLRRERFFQAATLY